MKLYYSKCNFKIYNQLNFQKVVIIICVLAYAYICLIKHYNMSAKTKGKSSEGCGPYTKGPILRSAVSHEREVATRGKATGKRRLTTTISQDVLLYDKFAVNEITPKLSLSVDHGYI